MKDNVISREEIENIYVMNPHVEYICVLMSSNHIKFDSVTGMSHERVVKKYEVTLFLEDGGYTVIDGVKHGIRYGSIRFLKPGQTVVSNKFGEYSSVHFSLINTDEALKNNYFINEMPSFMDSRNPKAYLTLFNELTVANSSNTIESALLLKYKMNKLLYNLFITAQTCKKPIEIIDKSRTTIDKAIEFIESNLSKNIGLDEISAHVNLHPVYFNRIFSKTVGTPPIGFLNRRRLEKAKDLLLTTNMKIVNIAVKCGFSTSSYFIVQFKREYGCTPSVYRLINSEY